MQYQVQALEYQTTSVFQSSELKQRVSDNIDELCDELESDDGAFDDFDDEDVEDYTEEAGTDLGGAAPGGAPVGGASTVDGDPTYEMACVRRNITGEPPLSRFVLNSRKMFLMQVNSTPIMFQLSVLQAVVTSQFLCTLNSYF